MENALMVRNIDDVNRIAEMMVKSGAFKDLKNVALAGVKILAGRDLGLNPVEAMRGLHVYDGQIELAAHLMAGRIKASGKYDYRVKEAGATGATVEFFENGESIGVSKFDEEDAKRADLLGKKNWRSYPEDMYYARALSRGARRFCPDIFNGPIYAPGEISEEKDVTPQQEAAPARKGLVAAWNTETQELDVYQPVSAPEDVDHDDYPPKTLADDDIPDVEPPMTPNQRLKLLGMLKQIGVFDGDKRALIDHCKLGKSEANALIDNLVEGGSDRFPWNLFAAYIAMLRDRVGKTNEDILDYCVHELECTHPSGLNRNGRAALIEWLHSFDVDEETVQTGAGDPN